MLCVHRKQKSPNFFGTQLLDKKDVRLFCTLIHSDVPEKYEHTYSLTQPNTTVVPLCCPPPLCKGYYRYLCQYNVVLFRWCQVSLYCPLNKQSCSKKTCYNSRCLEDSVCYSISYNMVLLRLCNVHNIFKFVAVHAKRFAGNVTNKYLLLWQRWSCVSAV